MNKILYTSEQVREFDRIAIEDQGVPGITLMRRAADACVSALKDHWPDSKQVTVYCGSGNNAGDGYIVAGILAEQGYKVLVKVVGKIEGLSPDAKKAREYCLGTDARVVVFNTEAFNTKDSNQSKGGDADVIVDALLGIGAIGDVSPHFTAAIEEINGSKKAVLSVDIPSGLNANTGEALGSVVLADITMTFIGLKRGMFTSDGVHFSGDILFDDLGVEIAPEKGATLLRYENLIDQFPPRSRQSHKNDFGHVLVIGGDSGMGGAVLMTAEAALRAGAGLVSVATHRDHSSTILARCPALMVTGLSNADQLDAMLKQADVIILGTGLGQSAWSKEIFSKALIHIQDERLSAEKRFVIDADGLNLLAETEIKNSRWVLTPHPGEARRLLRKKVEDRFASIKTLQEEYGGVVLLKGAGTIIQSQIAQSVCPYGNPGMSTAGMGDVLSGVIGGLLAQSCPLYFATQLAVVVHSMAADQCVAENGERGLLATDLFLEIRRLLNAC